MLRKLFALAVVLALIGLGVFWVVTIPATVPASALGQHTPNAANGKTMFYAGGCASCHATPGQDDKTKLGGGLGLKSPFGTFYVPNISPDPNDGIGKWSEADFVTAMLKGTSPDGRHYFPAFPYTSYQRYAHGRRARPVRAPQDPARRAGPGARPRRAVPVQCAASARRLETPVPRRSTIQAGHVEIRAMESRRLSGERPRPLRRMPFSPRNLLGGIVSSQRFAGGPNPEGEGWIPNITQAALKDYSDKDIAYILETGNTPDGDSVGGSMTAVVRNTSQLSAEDRNAMASYIKSLPPVEGPKKPEKK